MRHSLFIIILLTLFLFFPSNVFAVENPLAVPNNKVGVHILFPGEIKDAAKLVNSNGGDWGYVTVPIQTNDRDLNKWQTFMDNAKTLHVIPILRLATEGDFYNTTVWRKPTIFDLLDFATFLNQLSWPTKNRYLIVFNEPNRADEWGGKPNPSEYAYILQDAITIFKQKSDDFFIISAGLDNAAVTTGDGTSYTWDDFMTKMHDGAPDLFSHIDGLGSHSYPNPAFGKDPEVDDPMSIKTYTYEQQLIASFGATLLPVFITETGWSQAALSNTTIAQYFTRAFTNKWTDANIVAITPFLLRAYTPPFHVFSLLAEGDQTTPQYTAIADVPKIAGEPLIASPSATMSAVLAQESVIHINKPVSQQNFDVARWLQNLFNPVVQAFTHLL